MGMNFTFQESSVLYGMLAESSTDIIFKTDPDGAIVAGCAWPTRRRPLKRDVPNPVASGVPRRPNPCGPR